MSPEKGFFLAILATLTLPGLFSSAFAQQARSTAETYPVLVNVVDLHGNDIRDLSKNDFHVRINGKPAVISDAQYSVAPRRIVIVLDMSGSMAGEIDSGKWLVAREVVDDFLSQMPSDAPVAMVTFSDQVYQIVDFSQGRTAIAEWLKQGPSERANIKRSKTALFDAILAGLKLLEPFRQGDVVYAITDGEDNHSQSSKASTEDTLLKSGVRLFAFVFGETTPTVEGQEVKEMFQEMIADSGGIAFVISGRQVPGGTSWNVHYDNDRHSQEQIKVFTQQINNQVKGFWILHLPVPSLGKQSKLKVEILDQRGKARKDLAFSYPRVLPPTK